MIDLLKTRRSIRKFKDIDIEEEKLDTIIKSALLSPSSKSRKPWEFIVVKDKKILENLSKCREHGSKFLKEAPIGIVVIADEEVCDVWIEDTSISSVLIQLAAHSLGLGSCWIQIRKRAYSEEESAGDYVKKALNIPKKYKVESIIAIGYSDEEKLPYDEKSLLYNKVHYNNYSKN